MTSETREKQMGLQRINGVLPASETRDKSKMGQGMETRIRIAERNGDAAPETRVDIEKPHQKIHLLFVNSERTCQKIKRRNTKTAAYVAHPASETPEKNVR